MPARPCAFDAACLHPDRTVGDDQPHRSGYGWVVHDDCYQEAVRVTAASRARMVGEVLPAFERQGAAIAAWLNQPHVRGLSRVHGGHLRQVADG